MCMNMKNTLFRIFNLIFGFFPTPVPQGGTEFEKWSDSIIETYKPAADVRSVKFALCALLMRLDPTEAFKSKFYFALCLRKAAAAQVAAFKMEEIKLQQAEEAKKLQEKEAAENVSLQNQEVSEA
jgi:hypothetical protein